jgi:hypothetical protein
LTFVIFEPEGNIHMIATRANKEGQSKALKTTCEHLLQTLYKDHRQMKNRTHFYSVVGLGLVLTGAFLYKFYTGIVPYYNLDTSPLAFMSFIAGVGVVSAFGIARVFELEMTQYNEVSGDFYEHFVKTAEKFPDLAIAVEGQTHLTIRDAKGSLSRLRCRAMIEIQNEKPAGDTAAKVLHDLQRASFQQISLKDTTLVSTPSTPN